ncbi:26S proteasome non-ATPase regulatory subunit 11 [Strongyloides ratti]|uniref:26S proteasome non-ATPase regulatory subunit 11 n=1 Tax=Strongyloides ratti TaxID=34506 RepID=A0A090LA19_STRRB|nr:26S proteasome non-ATPase regulatory subunit 11 [Strongyloides ratti]CEF64350.1 26S proteasome non-ATPase regulatory subunit 11 [Strongyloides ratti]
MSSIVKENESEIIKKKSQISDSSSIRKATLLCLIHNLKKETNEQLFNELELQLLNLCTNVVTPNDFSKLGEILQELKPVLRILSSRRLEKFLTKIADVVSSSKSNYLKRANVLQTLIIVVFDINRHYLGYNLLLKYLKHCNNNKMYRNVVRSAKRIIHTLKIMSVNDILIEIYLEESIAYYCLKNYMKAKAALMNAKTLSNASNLEPVIQSKLDMHSGAIFLIEKEYHTAFSYFYEALESYDGNNKKKEAIQAIQYLCLTKLMINKPDEVKNFISSKFGIKYYGEELYCMEQMANAVAKKCVKLFDTAAKNYPSFQDDVVMKSSLKHLYNFMFDQDILRIIKPYSFVEIDFIATKIGLASNKIEQRLCTMIIDGQIEGKINHDNRSLEIIPTTKYEKDTEILDLSHTLIKKVDLITTISQVHISSMDRFKIKKKTLPKVIKKKIR